MSALDVRAVARLLALPNAEIAPLAANSEGPLWSFVDERRLRGWPAHEILAEVEREVAHAIGLSMPPGLIAVRQTPQLGRLMNQLVPLVLCRYYSPRFRNRTEPDGAGGSSGEHSTSSP